MTSVWTRRILPIMLTILFSYFIIPLSLIFVSFSRFLRRELKKLMDRYGRDNVVKLFLQGNIKGLLDLFILSRKGKKSSES
jgi:hypothetical protein